jgi:hypothetical protein
MQETAMKVPPSAAETEPTPQPNPRDLISHH